MTYLSSLSNAFYEQPVFLAELQVIKVLYPAIFSKFKLKLPGIKIPVPIKKSIFDNACSNMP